MAGAVPSVGKVCATQNHPRFLCKSITDKQRNSTIISLFTCSALNRLSRLSRTSEGIFWGAGLTPEKGEVLVCYAKKSKVFSFQEIFEKRS